MNLRSKWPQQICRSFITQNFSAVARSLTSTPLGAGNSSFLSVSRCPFERILNTMTGAAGTTPVCAPDSDGATTGACLYTCAAGSMYVSTGGCPTGSRCFDLGDFALGFRDCNSASDCFADERCDEEGSCVPIRMDGGPGGSDAGAGSDAG